MDYMTNLATDLPRKYRYKYETRLFAGSWRHSYSIIGAAGGIQLNVSGPHIYDNRENWSAGLEYHSRKPRNTDEAPSHDDCHLLKAPCWHDGTSLYAQERYLPLFMKGCHDMIFRYMANDADRYWEESP